MANSVVTGSDLELGGDLFFRRTDSGSFITFYRQNAAGADITDGQGVGVIVFKGMVSGTPTNLGSITSFYKTSPALGGVLRLASTGGAWIDLTDNGTASHVLISAAGGSQFIHVQQGGLRFSTGAPGSLWYQGAFFVTDIPISGTVPAPKFLKATGTVPFWATLTAADIGAGPGDPVNTLQWNSAGTFAALSGSVVTGPNVQLAGDVSIVDATGHTLLFHRTAVPASDGDSLGQIYFRAGATDIAAFRCYWTTAFSAGYTIEMARSATKRIYISDIAAQMDYSGHFLKLISTGIQVSTGSTGSVFYQNASDLFVGLPIDPTGTKYLKSNGTMPVWAVASVDAANFTGVLSVTHGGTGTGTAPTAIGQILRADSTSSYQPVTIQGSGTVSISYDGPSNTLTFLGTGGAGATTPGLPSNSLQWNSAGGFAGFSGSIVSGTTLTLPGDVTLTNTATINFYFKRESDHTSGTGLDTGIITFRGKRPSLAAVDYGYVRGFFDETGTVDWAVEMGRSASCRLTVGASYITMTVGSAFWSVQSTGVKTSVGNLGAIYYKSNASDGQLSPLDLSASANKWLRVNSSGTAPTYQTITNADSSIVITEVAGGITIKSTVTGSATPGIPLNSLQWNSGSTFAGFNGSVVSGNDLTLPGNLTQTNAGAPEHFLIRTTAANLVDGSLLGQVSFKDSTTSAGVPKAVVRSYWTSTFSAGYVLELWMSTARRIFVSEGFVSLNHDGNFITVEPTGIRASVGALGSMFYQATGAGGNLYLTALAITNVPANQKWLRSSGTAPTWQTIAAGSNVTITESGTGIIIAASGVGGGTPGGNPDEVQWNSAGSFAGITGSKVVSPGFTITGAFSANSALVSATKTITVSSVTTDASIVMTQSTGASTTPPILLQMDRSRASGGSLTGTGVNADLAGEFRVRGVVGGTMQRLCGFIGGYDTGDGGFAKIAAGTTNTAQQVYVSEGSVVAQFTTSIKIALSVSGIQIVGHGGGTSSGSLLYRDGSGFLNGLAGGGGTFLKSSGAGFTPGWGSVTTSDLPVVPISKGGTNITVGPTATPNTTTAQVLMASSSGVWQVGTLQASSPVSFSYSGGVLTITSTGGSGSLSIDGSGTELLRRTSSTSLQTIPNSSVSGDDVTFGGRITQTDPVTTTGITHSIDRTVSGSNTIGNDYSALYWYHTSATGAHTSRKCLTLAFEYTGFSSLAASANGDAILELYAQTQNSPTLSGTTFHGIVIDLQLSVAPSTIHQIRLKPISASVTTKRAIYVESGAGDVVINAGTNLGVSATQGFLFVPVIAGVPTSGTTTGFNALVPAGTCAFAVSAADNALYANRGLGWMKVFFA
jgi:hypothetical protein